MRAATRSIPWAIGAVTVMAASCQSQSQDATPDLSPAQRAESLMMEAMGGREAWESARFFDFVWAAHRGDRPPVERHHIWDRWTGRYKLQMPTGDGDMVAVFNANTMEGDVWLNGERVEDAGRRDSLLDRAHAVYINDSYWLLMPYKWLDPGVNLEYMGMMADSTGREWEAVQLTFDNVGRTPNNRYMAYLDPETHLLGWWEHFREREMTETNTRTFWNAWEKRGPIMVSVDRPGLDGRPRISFPRVIISTEVDEAAFAPPGA